MAGREDTDPQPKTNILLVVLDDARRDLVAYMPNVLALARAGVTFSRAYSETPVCNPARANLLVGQSAARTRVSDWFGKDLDPAIERGTWSYDTSFASWIDLRSLAVGKYLNTKDALDPAGWTRFSQPRDANAHMVREVNHGSGFEQIPPTWHTDWELAEITRHIDGDPGWLVYWGSSTPHSPHAADPRNSNPWSGDVRLVREEQFGTAWPPWITSKPPLLDDDWRGVEAVRRGTIVEAVEWDQAFGTLMDRIDLGTTLVIVTSDNGLHHGDHRIAGIASKNTLYEAAVGIPLIVAGPRFPAGKTVDSLVGLLDITATITATARAHAPHPLDGVDLAKVAGDPTAYADRVLLGRRKPQLKDYPPCDWIITPTRKLGRHQVDEGHLYEMYDLDTDPSELVNVADVQGRSEERDDLERRLDDLLELT